MILLSGGGWEWSTLLINSYDISTKNSAICCRNHVKMSQYSVIPLQISFSQWFVSLVIGCCCLAHFGQQAYAAIGNIDKDFLYLGEKQMSVPSLSASDKKRCIFHEKGNRYFKGGLFFQITKPEMSFAQFSYSWSSLRSDCTWSTPS